MSEHPQYADELTPEEIAHRDGPDPDPDLDPDDVLEETLEFGDPDDGVTSDDGGAQ